MSELVTIATFFDRMEAELAKSILEDNDIVGMVSADDGGGMESPLLVATGGVRLIVRQEDAARAAELLQGVALSDDVDDNPT